MFIDWLIDWLIDWGWFTVDVTGDPLRMCWWTLYRLKLDSMVYISVVRIDCVCLSPLCSLCTNVGRVAKVSKNRRYLGSKLVKVVDFGTDRIPICDNSRTLSYSYSDVKSLKCRKSPFGHTRVSFNAIARGDTLRICWSPLYRPKLDSIYFLQNCQIGYVRVPRNSDTRYSDNWRHSIPHDRVHCVSKVPNFDYL